MPKYRNDGNENYIKIIDICGLMPVMCYILCYIVYIELHFLGLIKNTIDIIIIIIIKQYDTE